MIYTAISRAQTKCTFFDGNYDAITTIFNCTPEIMTLPKIERLIKSQQNTIIT